MSTLDNLRKDAKRWLKALRSHDADARARLARAYPEAAAPPGLRDVQHALAREHGHDSWKAMTDAVRREAAAAGDALSSDAQAVPPRRPRTVDEYDDVAHALTAAYAEDDANVLARLHGYFRAPVTHIDVRAMVWHAVRTVREARGAAHAFGIAEARDFLARDAGFSSWDTLATAMAVDARPEGAPYVLDSKTNRIGPRRRLSDEEWDTVIGVMKEQRITAFEANGFMTDAMLARIAELDHVVHLSIGGSRLLTDEGLQHLARMPQLRSLDLSEYPGGVLTDRGLDVLKQLPELRDFKMVWQAGITDAGISNLRYCERLESVNMMGTPTGDGAIEALRGKPYLRRLDTGKLVTDAGLALLKDIPLFRTGYGDVGAGTGDADSEEANQRVRLMLDGPFSNGALAHLAGLEGLTALSFFWHVTSLTSDALASLPALPNLRHLNWDGELCDDVAMRHIGMMPTLRNLQAQGAVATDAGFEALSRSQTIETIWGRVCPNLTGPGFVALSRMPALRSLAVSAARVDDTSLASLPRFPSLTQLTSIGIQDEGFRYVGQCERLEHLSCMYCRDTTDAATARIARLPRLKTYYAGATRITDRSLEILGTIDSLERVEIYECLQITNEGLPHLARLPRLREVSFSGLPRVTLGGTRVFPAGVRVDYSQ